MEKFLLLCRHSDKTKDGKHISATGLKLVMDCFPGMIVASARLADLSGQRTVDDFFHGPLVRTSETMAAAVIAAKSYIAEVHSEAINQLGSQETFDKYFKDGFRDAVKATGSNYLGAKQIFGGKFDHECQVCLEGVKDMFNKMEKQFAAGLFHSPTVEMAASKCLWNCPEAVDGKMPENLILASLDGILFKHDESDVITIIGVVRAKAINQI